MSKFVFTEPTRYALANAICEQAGIDPNYVRRIVIDLQINEVGKVYVELMADDEVLGVDLSKMDIKIKEAENGG